MDIEELAASNVCQVSIRIHGLIYDATKHLPKNLSISGFVGANVWPAYLTIREHLIHEHRQLGKK